MAISVEFSRRQIGNAAAAATATAPRWIPERGEVLGNYREKGFKNYSELIFLLLMAERNNDLLMRNHKNRPTRSTPLPEVDEVYSRYAKRRKGRDPVRGRCRGQRRNFLGFNHPPKKNNHQKWKGKDEKPKAKGSEAEYYRCGGKGHWANIYRTPRHLVELYQASLKNKGPEANFVSNNEFDITHLDMTDFFEHPDGKIDHLIGDKSVVKDD
ncbi:uncharacterized protein LOC142163985 [Nicotiana tabacum]|uniref:Uncharacterized protein LOC142163985 n=1 Tax=Nicotiana tabacum TaxID=4097 RepID=A0AC58RX40_TOBAC